MLVCECARACVRVRAGAAVDRPLPCRAGTAEAVATGKVNPFAPSSPKLAGIVSSGYLMAKLKSASQSSGTLRARFRSASLFSVCGSVASHGPTFVVLGVWADCDDRVEVAYRGRW